MLSKKETDDLLMRILALGSHCAATADQTEELAGKIKKKKISRRKAAREVKELEGHMEDLRMLIVQVANHVSGSTISELAERN